MPVPNKTGEFSAARLAGTGVIVTRPRHQCAGLLRMLQKCGAHVRCLPVIQIEPPADTAPARRALDRFGSFHMAVFTSTNAVEGAVALRPDLNAYAGSVAVAAVGPGTRRALEGAGIGVSVMPENEFSSEGLLGHSTLAADEVRGRRILIVKGEGGRAVLFERLTAAGAEVSCADVYRRRRPEVRIPELLDEPLSRFALIVITSGTAIEHLLELATAAETAEILNMQFVVSSGRIADLARTAGARRAPIIAEGPGDEALVRAVRSWPAAEPDRITHSS